MVNDHFVLWPWRPRELQFNSPHILSFVAESIIKLAGIQSRHLHLGAVLVPWSLLFSEFLCLVSHSLAVSPFRKLCLSSWSRQYIKKINNKDLLYGTVNYTHAPQFSSVQFSRSVVSDSLRPHGRQHARPPIPSPTPGVYLVIIYNGI